MQSLKEIAMEVTYDCPHNCLMCSSSACHPSPLKKELTLEEIKKTLYTACTSTGTYATHLSLSGGDPLQRPDIFKIMKLGNELGLHNLLYTTGQRVKEDYKGDPILHKMTTSDARKLSRLNVTAIFDLQSPDEKTCDKIMGTDGYFENVVHAIKLCTSYGIPVETHFVPMTINFKHYFDYIDFAQTLNIEKLSFLRFVRQGRGHNNKHLELSKSQFKELQHMFIRTEYEYPNFPDFIRLGHPIDRRWMVHPKYEIKVCRGATDAPLIHPEGSVVMCPAWKELTRYSAGNIRTQSLPEIMESNPYYNIFHNFIHNEGYKQISGKCQECPYLSKCKGGCVAQRLIYNVGNAEIPLQEAIKLGSDPMCFLDI